MKMQHSSSPSSSSSSSSIYLNLTKCSDLLDNVLNNLDPLQLKSLSAHDINEINQVLYNIEGALKYIDSKTRNIQ